MGGGAGGRAGGRLSPSASLLRAPYGANKKEEIWNKKWADYADFRQVTTHNCPYLASLSIIQNYFFGDQEYPPLL